MLYWVIMVVLYVVLFIYKIEMGIDLYYMDWVFIVKGVYVRNVD